MGNSPKVNRKERIGKPMIFLSILELLLHCQERCIAAPLTLGKRKKKIEEKWVCLFALRIVVQP